MSRTDPIGFVSQVMTDAETGPVAGYSLLPGIFFFGFLRILGDDRRQAGRNKLARTWAVYAWDARSDETFLTDSRYADP